MRTYLLSAHFARILSGTLIFCACMGTESGPAAKEWTGLARRSCGPADGPAIEILIDSMPMTCDSPRAGSIRFYNPGLILDSLSPGTVILVGPVTACPVKTMNPADDLRLEIIQRDSAGISVRFRRIRTYPCTPLPIRPDTLEAAARLRICSEGPGPMCG
jgi:hypothetical protein